MPRLPRRFHDHQRGQSLVELALVLPILLVLLAAALDLGRVFYSTVSLNNAAREGALQAAETPSSYVEDAACNTATNLVVCRVLLEAKGTMTTILPTDIDVKCNPVDVPLPCPKQAASLVTVEVRGTFTLLTPLLRGILGTDTLNLRSTASAQVNYLPPAAAVPSATPSASVSPSASASASPTPTASCTPVPNVIGMSPTDAAIALDSAGFLGTGIGDLTTGPKMKVQAQSIDSSQCREAFANPRLEIVFQYRPQN